MSDRPEMLMDKDPEPWVLTKQGFNDAVNAIKNTPRPVFKVYFDRLILPRIMTQPDSYPEGVNPVLVDMLWQRPRDETDIREVLTDNSMKDIQEEEDRRFLSILGGITGGQSQSTAH